MSLGIKAGGSLHPTSEETLKKGWHNIYQDGKAVFKYAVSEMSHVAEQIMKRNKLNEESLDYLVPHQANKRIIDAASKRCGIDPKKVIINIGDYGNTTAGTIPIALNEAFQNNQIHDGDLLLLSSFGAGFTWGSILIRWKLHD